MSPLRQQMHDAMLVRGLSLHTRQAYIDAVARLARFYHTSPALLTSDQVEAAILILANSPGFWLWGIWLETFQHEIHQRLPGLKTQVTGQCPDVIEQALP